ncbi:hypothetical protein OG921_21695 [Aldersonia sp. NBC_00410]|uniref:hypothetical protein n=1 Tax=Aldersonia sp. NBC_00410 TaxID=2975954 RepID=UPI00224DE971|nr:hypothetical protein [Aldersonia sp. NBC_00410]MCX5045784.1 hypothetical protein [Aldersonia sp. NBC_00410]
MTAPGARPPRRRVVLSERRGARMVRTRVEVQEQTAVGEALIRGLMRAQLGLAIRVVVVIVLLVGSIPLLCFTFPAFGAASVWGVRLPWLFLGALVYPLLYVVGKVYVRLAERNEQEFTDVLED